MSMLQWISWYQPTEDPRPLNFPPNQYVLGWWVTGETMDGVQILCALVIATTEENAQRITKVDWPEAEDWRFCEETETTELSDRFPYPDWAEKRVKDYNENVS